MSQHRSQYVKAKVNSSHHRKKVEEHQQALRRGQKLLAVTESELEEERQELAQLERVWRRYEKEVQEKGASGGRDIELDGDQVRPKGLDQRPEIMSRIPERLFFPLSGKLPPRPAGEMNSSCWFLVCLFLSCSATTS